MRAGALRNVITIQQLTEAGVDRLNAPNEAWGTVVEDLPCEKTTRRGKEHFDATTRERFYEDITRFRVRRFEVEGIDTTMRIMFEGDAYDIIHLIPDDQHDQDCIIEAKRQNGGV